MEEILIRRPEIPLEDFLPIFISGALVIVFGAAYVGVFTLVKIKKLKNHFMPLAYAFWALLTYCLYLLSHLIGSEPFTQKVLMMAMVAYLLFPHFIYFLMDKTHEAYEH
ncbi:MAG: hypothetical protein K0U47_04860 [Epsilonproteobacteria bacterium]|nr:hypothetical protein [Campylobacterota bacterium]